MPTLYLTDEEYQVLEQESQNLGVCVNEYALSRLFPNKKDNPVYLIDLLNELPKSQLNKSGLQIQQELRNEWD